MKSKKARHDSSSEESEESDASQKSNSSSDSDSEDSSASEHRQKKKRKHADSSQSESDSEGQRHSKKRKHKKKKKKHGKKKRREESGEESDSDVSSESEGETSRKRRKHKHKHKSSKRARSASASIKEISDEDPEEERLHSVVKERRESSVEGSQPSRTYYQKEYRQEGSADEYESQREQEVQRFYRGSSRDRRAQEAYEYERSRNDRYQQDKYKNAERYGQNSHYNGSGDQYQQRRPKDYEEYKRNTRYEEHQRPDQDTSGYHRKPDYNARGAHHDGPQRGGYHRFNQHQHQQPYEDRGPRRNFDGNRGNRPPYHDNRRGGPPDGDRFHGREYPDKKERFPDQEFSSDRGRDVRRDRPVPARVERPERSERPDRPERIPVQAPRESRSPVVSSKLDPRERRDERRERPREDRPREDRPREDRPREDRSREDRPRPADRPIERERSRPSGDREREARARSDGRPERGSPRPRERKSRFAASGDDNKEYEWGKTEVKKEGADPEDKEKPNFGLSGKLTADANTVNGVVIKYTEPDDAKQPKRRWRFYPFKGDKALPILYIHRQSCFVMGRDKKVVDIHLEHPSVSKQHAALQYRATPFTRPDGSQGRRVRPYIIDLESANGTFVNNKKIEGRRYVELLERDVVKFGFSAREYVLLHENSKDDAQDDDNQDTAAALLGASVTTTEQIKHEKRAKQAAVADGD